jgi:anthranilate/para-aminobenzoate synthase component I
MQAGAGIVADSDPAREWLETEHKLGSLKAALSEAVR